MYRSSRKLALRATPALLISPWDPSERLKQYSKDKPLFTARGPVHLYSSKENAFQGFSDERGYGMMRMKQFMRKMWSEKGSRWYISLTLFGILIGGYVMFRQRDEVYLRDGLIGPKKKIYRSRLTVVLDVDETIVSYGDKAFRMRAGLVTRPYLAELLDYLNEIDAEVILWSACSNRYMKHVLQAIDPNGTRVSQFLVRDDVWYVRDGFYEKNIRWLNRGLDNVVVIENRATPVRNCNSNAILVPDFIRGEYMDNGQDYPPNDKALLYIKEILEDLEKSGLPVDAYLRDPKRRHKEINEIPCHLAMRQLPDELAVGNFYFVQDKFKPGAVRATGF
jgi:hypothetical protein